MRDLIYPPFVTGRGALGLLLLRLVTGAAFLFHGWPKIQNPFAWMPPGAEVPGALQFLAALAEFGGGIALILGLLTPLASLGLISTMGFAIFKYHIPHGDPFVKPGSASWELAAVYFVISLLLLLVGPGVVSLDALLFGRREVTAAGRYAGATYASTR